VGFSVRSYLEQLPSCEGVAMTRTNDTDVSLADRVAYANAGGYDRFISLHHNAFNGNVQGTETYCWGDGLPGSFQLRDAIHPHLIDAFQYTDRGTKTADFYVIKYTLMPSMLGEASFLDYILLWDESWRFMTRYNDHQGLEGFAYSSGLCQNVSSPEMPEYGNRVSDNAYPTCTLSGGDWGTGTDGDHFGPDYALRTVSGTPGGAEWNPWIAESGWYEVGMWWVAGADRAENVSVLLQHHQGQEQFTVDQTGGGGGWYVLGTFFFHAGNFGRVSVSDASCQPGRVVVADAVRFSLAPLGIEDHEVRNGPGLLVRPNPATGPVLIRPPAYMNAVSADIYDCSGRLVDRISADEGSEDLIWNSEGHGPGLYFAAVRTGETRLSASFVVLPR